MIEEFYHKCPVCKRVWGHTGCSNTNVLPTYCPNDLPSNQPPYPDCKEWAYEDDLITNTILDVDGGW